jgi:hypothetical protein
MQTTEYSIKSPIIKNGATGPLRSFHLKSVGWNTDRKRYVMRTAIKGVANDVDLRIWR